MEYRQVLKYAVFNPVGKDIMEKSYVMVKTKSGKTYIGDLYDVGSCLITLINSEWSGDEKIEYENIALIEQLD